MERLKLLLAAIDDLMQAIDDNRETWEVPDRTQYSDDTMTVIPYQYIYDEVEAVENLMKDIRIHLHLHLKGV